MNISDYVKLEELKRMVVTHLRTLGMMEETATINENDLDLLLTLMSQLNKELLSKNSHEERLEFTISYIIGLWGRLIISYGAKLEDL